MSSIRFSSLLGRAQSAAGDYFNVRIHSPQFVLHLVSVHTGHHHVQQDTSDCAGMLAIGTDSLETSASGQNLVVVGFQGLLLLLRGSRLRRRPPE